MTKKKIDLDKLVTYDLETITNLFTACFTDYKTKYKKEFILFDDINEFYSLFKFLKSLDRAGYGMISFNGIGFDNQIVEYILDNGQHWINNPLCSIQDIVTALYDKAQWVISLPDDEKFKQLIPEFRFTIPAIDLYKQKHYDRPQKATSLKWLQFSMRYHNIEEMPIEHDTIVTKDMIPSIMGYNWNDVDSTEAFFDRIKFETELRLKLEEKYGLNLINAAEPRLAREIFGKFLCEQMKIPYSELKKMRTFRKNIKVRDIIFPYIKFNSPELNTILESFKKLILNPNEKMEFNYEFKYGGIDTVLGLGGIHACCNSGNYSKQKGKVIHDIDVVSFYPNLAIKNGLKPAHLGDIFTKVYEDIFEQRKSIPKSDPINYVFKIILNSAYGLSNEKNSYLYDPQFTMGITINGQLSILMLVEMLLAKIPDLQIYQENTDGITIGYDEKLLPLVQEIVKEWQEITKLDTEEAFYQQMVINDVNNYIGVYEEKKVKDNDKVEWLKMQKKEPLYMFREENGIYLYTAVKTKGMFEVNLDYHKNPSFLVIPKAMYHHFVKDMDYRKFIESHTDIFDYCGGIKKKHGFELNIYKLENRKLDLNKYQSVEHLLNEHGFYQIGEDAWRKKDGGEMSWVTTEIATGIIKKTYEQTLVNKQKQQKVTRFYVSKDGGRLVKDFKDKRRTMVLKDWLVTPLNKIETTDINDYKNIDYKFYIKEVEKIISTIEGDNRQLQLF